MEDQLIELAKRFAGAIAANDVEGINDYVADDWIIVGPDGEIIDKARFVEVIKSGALLHKTMETTDWRVRIYDSTAVVTGLTSTTGTFMAQDFTSCERATDVFVKQGG